jgi:hypothetical protein
MKKTLASLNGKKIKKNDLITVKGGLLILVPVLYLLVATHL